MADDTDQDLNVDLNEETFDVSESLDSDSLGERVGDDGYDAPDGWTAAERYGNTPDEERDGETLDQKLAEERPDVALEEQPEVSTSATPDDELDSSVDDEVLGAQPVDDETVADTPGTMGLEELRDTVGADSVVVEEQPTAPDEVYPA